jgi:hypothetical protein
MSNMSYCRWENTFIDLLDCAEALHDTLSPMEAMYRRKLLFAAADMLNDIGMSIDMDQVRKATEALPEYE